MHARMTGVHFVDGAGHWVQQEQPEDRGAPGRFSARPRVAARPAARVALSWRVMRHIRSLFLILVAVITIGSTRADDSVTALTAQIEAPSRAPANSPR